MMAVVSKGPRILIVEDDASLAKDLWHTLMEQGFEPCGTAACPEDALLHFERLRPDLVMMDVRLRGADGIDVGRALRERYTTPIIYLAAYVDPATLERARLTEPSAFLLKPISRAELEMSIEIALHKAANTGARRVPRLEAVAGERSDGVEHLAALGRMAAGVAHQINNPLAVVAANADVVACELERQRAQRASDVRVSATELQRLDETIEAQAELGLAAQRIARIVANIRSFSSPAARLDEVADVRRAVDRAISLTGLEMGERARLAIEVPDLPPVATSQARLTEVLEQLLLNAAYAVAQVPRAAHVVAVRARSTESGEVLIEVLDTGAGMAPEVQERIFEPFFTTKPLGTGTGLGLSICHGIVAAAGGHLEVESQAGVGTRCSIVLPAAPEAARRSHIEALLPARAVRSSGPSMVARSARAKVRPAASRATSRRCILVVDDEPMLLRSVRRLLPEYELVCLESAREALDLLDAGRSFDLIVSDLMMPEMTGIDFYEALCARHPDAARRVIFITG
ncbi:MAG TPA: response regulator, partial [Polyangiaceae bacterium]|nr:response regulator [Polyangiaceae bacterium]